MKSKKSIDERNSESWDSIKEETCEKNHLNESASLNSQTKRMKRLNQVNLSYKKRIRNESITAWIATQIFSSAEVKMIDFSIYTFIWLYSFFHSNVSENFVISSLLHNMRLFLQIDAFRTYSISSSYSFSFLASNQFRCSILKIIIDFS
jgi:hypothetical protein